MGKSSGETSQVKVPKRIREAQKTALGAAQDLFSQGLGQEQLEGIGLQEEFARQALPGLNQQLFGSFGTALDAGNVFTDPSVMAGLGTIENRALRTFGEDILPQLRQQATGVGQQFGSKAEQSERLAARDLQQAISDAQAQFLSGQLGSARGLQASAIGSAPGTLATGLMPGQILGGTRIGAERDLVNTLTSQMSPFAGGAAGGTTIAGQGGSDMLGNLIGGGLLGSSLGTGIQNAAFGALGAGSGAFSAPLMALSGPWGMAAGIGAGLLGGALS